MFEIVDATDAHAVAMAPNVRLIELAEIDASVAASALSALRYSMLHSLYSKAWIVDGDVACMWGVGVISALDEDYIPWALATPLVEKHPIAFLRTSLKLRDEMVSNFKALSGFVDERHAYSVRWLKWLGFSLSDPVSDRFRFHKFTLRAD